MALHEVTTASIEAALHEFDSVGRDAFLKKYGFRRSRAYFIEHEGKRYDSKAVAGAAHGYLPGHGPLENTEFSGGEDTVATKLRDRGFTVVVGPQRPRNPPWTQDELILALDLYMSAPASPPGKGSAEVAELSKTLKRLASLLEIDTGPDHRNPNGVYMKVMNFRRFDQAFRAVGKIGLTHGAIGDENVWNEFASRPDRLREVANGIRLGSLDTDLRRFLPEPYMAEASEGRTYTAKHLRRERNPKLIADRKRKAFDETGELRCEGCGLSFGERYGKHGDGFIEVHHTKPVHTLANEGEKTKLEDLSLVCANCHRMIHRSRNWLEMDALRQLLSLAHIG